MPEPSRRGQPFTPSHQWCDSLNCATKRGWAEVFIPYDLMAYDIEGIRSLWLASYTGVTPAVFGHGMTVTRTEHQP